MASSMNLVIFVVVVALVSANPSAVEDSVTHHAKSAAIVTGHLDDVTSLLQTDITMSPTKVTGTDMQNRTAGSTPRVVAPEDPDLVTRIWQWVTQTSQLDMRTRDATEAAKRFHKDFIAAALLMTCVLPFSQQGESTAEGTRAEGRSRLWRILPSGQSLRILCVLLLWLKHYWLKEQHAFLEISFVLLGFAFDFVNRHAECEEDLWRKLSMFVPDKFARLYPFYVFYVIAYYLVFFSSPSSVNESIIGSNLLLSRACGIGAWLLSVVFGIYLVLPVLTTPPQQMQSSGVAMICAGCVAMVVMPRTLAAPAHSPWPSLEEQASSMHSHPDGAVYEIFFARRSLLLGLVHFFLGLVLSRAHLVIKFGCGSFLMAYTEERCKESQYEVTDAGNVADTPSGKGEAELWKAFEDEAKQDMIRSLSMNKSADHMDHGYSMSPRSNHSD